MTRRLSVPICARSSVAALAVVALASVACGPSATPSPSIISVPGTAGPSSAIGTPSTASPPASLSASPSASPSGLAAECTTLATGLLNPRGLTVGSDGTIYVAEAGAGGTEADYPTSPVGSPAASSPAASSAASLEPSVGPSGSPGPVAMHGETGQVTKITPDGQQSVFVSGLTSYFFGTEVVGPADVAVGNDGKIYVSIGGPGPLTAQFEPAGNADSVVSVDSTGTVTPLANIGNYERENNPDPYAIDSDVGGLTLGSDGLLYVADSGGNDLYSVDPATGTLKLVTVFPGLPSLNGAPNPSRGGKPEVDPVPTDVTTDPKGGVYVGFLSGAALWGSPGAAKIVHVGIDGKVEDSVTGLNMVTGVAESNETLYASELSTNFTTTPPSPGEIAQAALGGTPEPIFTDAPLPYGIALSPDGTSMYIVINASAEPGTTPNGEVINCPLPAPVTPSPSASPSAAASPSASPEESASPAGSATPKPTKSPTTEPTVEPSESAAPSESPSLLPSLALPTTP